MMHGWIKFAWISCTSIEVCLVSLPRMHMLIMNRPADDMEHIPYQSHLSARPAKASPIITNALPHRPFTPTRVPSFRSRTPLGRSQSPAPPLPGSGIIGQPSPSATPTHSAPGTPTFAHAALANPLAQLTAERLLAGGLGSGSSASALLAAGSAGGSPKSAHASPATSPKVMNAKANLFAPTSGAPGGSSAPGLLGNKPHIALPSPFNTAGGDPWAQFGRLASPAGTPPAMSRQSSNLALAAPLTAANMFAHHASLNQNVNENAFDNHQPNQPRSEINGNGMQIPRHEMDDAGVDDIFSTSAMDRHSQFLPHHDDDEDDDEFSPFGRKPVGGFRSTRPPGLGYDDHAPGSGAGSLSTSPATKLQVSAKAFDPTKLGVPGAGGNMDPNAPGFMPSPGMTTPNGTRMGGAGAYFGGEGYSEGYGTPGSEGVPGGHGEEGGYLGDGMTPLDVLQSVFTSLPPGELEDALVKSGYEFEGAMALLIAQNGGTRSANSGTSTPTGLRPDMHRGFGRGAGGRDANYFYQGGRGNAPFGGGTGHLSPRFAMGGSGTRSPGGGLKMCRYYLAGECRRADCRFRFVIVYAFIPYVWLTRPIHFSHDVDRALCRFWLRGQCAKGDMCE